MKQSAYRLFTLLFFLALGSGLQAQQGFLINGTIRNGDGRKVYLAETAQTIPMDSALIEQGHFTLKGHVTEPKYVVLLVQGKAPYSSFILSNENIKIVGEADSMQLALVDGSVELKDEALLKQQLKPVLDLQKIFNDSANRYFRAGDSAAGNKNLFFLAQQKAAANALVSKFISKHTGSFVSLVQLSELHKSLRSEEATQLFISLATSLREHSIGKRLKYEIFENAQMNTVGTLAKEFKLPDTSGKSIGLRKFRGKYVLVDFWASWCGPCRYENPNLKAAYDRYNSRGFDVLGVSLDSEREAWLTAVRKDGLTWTQVSDFKGFNNRAALMYAVTELPANYLIDPNGKIVARNLKGDALWRQLELVLGQ